MALVYDTAKDLLSKMVGIDGSASYLALSSTKPRVIPDKTVSNQYNITEPTGSSYKRTQLHSRGYFDDVTLSTGEKITAIITADGTVTAQNTSEIHFTECTDEAGWGSYTYFAIYSSLTGGTPKYVGKLKTSITVTKNTVPLIRAKNLQISVLSTDLDAE